MNQTRPHVHQDTQSQTTKVKMFLLWGSSLTQRCLATCLTLPPIPFLSVRLSSSCLFLFVGIFLGCPFYLLFAVFSHLVSYFCFSWGAFPFLGWFSSYLFEVSICLYVSFLTANKHCHASFRRFTLFLCSVFNFRAALLVSLLYPEISQQQNMAETQRQQNKFLFDKFRLVQLCSQVLL